MNIWRARASVVITMRTPEMPVSAWFFTLGSAAVFLIGAFGNFKPGEDLDGNPGKIAPVRAQASASEAAPEQFSPGIEEIVRLARAHVPPSLILSYIRNGHEQYAPTPEELLYLSKLGVPDGVLAALVPPPVVPPEQTPETPPVVSPTQLAEATPAPIFPVNPPAPIVVEHDYQTVVETPIIEEEDVVPLTAWTPAPPVEVVVALPPLIYRSAAAAAVRPGRSRAVGALRLPPSILPPVGHPSRPRKAAEHWQFAERTPPVASHYSPGLAPESISRTSERVR